MKQMNCKSCTYIITPGTIRCEICFTETNIMESWFSERNLEDLYTKILSIGINNIFQDNNLSIALSSSGLTSIEAIQLAYEIGLYKGKNEGTPESVYKDRLLRQQQDFEYQLCLLNDKIASMEVESKDEEEDIVVEEKSEELSSEERRRIIAESWCRKQV